MVPIGLLILARRQWGRLAGIVLAWTLLTGGLFVANAAITGEFNYQGGDRKTFYGYLGFPFANERETFDNIGPPQRLEAVLPGNVLATRHSVAVFRHNVRYFVFGRSSGLLPYFFPGVVSAVLFLAMRGRQPWQWLAGASIVGAMVMLLVLTPFTYSGGGGPVGNRYFLSFYPLFLLLTPAMVGLRSAAVAFAIGALFTAKILLNPFYSSFHAGEHLKSGAHRWLPLELTLLHPVPTSDEVHQQSQPRDDDHEDHPRRLGASAQVLASEDVSQDPEQAHEPGEEQEELEQGQQERTVVVEHRNLSWADPVDATGLRTQHCAIAGRWHPPTRMRIDGKSTRAGS